MEDILYCKDLYGPIDADSVKPENKTKKEWERMNRMTIDMARQWLDGFVFHHVANETSAHELWKKLESLHERRTTQNKIFLIQRLVNLKYKEERPISEHLSEFQYLVNQ